MFDFIDPVGSLANKYAGIPKTGVTTQADPKNIGEMITSRIPGASGGSFMGDVETMAQGNGETEDERKKREQKEAAVRAGNPQGMKKGGKVKAKAKPYTPKVSSASKRADGIATKGKTRGRIV